MSLLTFLRESLEKGNNYHVFVTRILNYLKTLSMDSKFVLPNTETLQVSLNKNSISDYGFRKTYFNDNIELPDSVIYNNLEYRLFFKVVNGEEWLVMELI